MCLASVITNLGMTLIHDQRYRCTLPSLCPLASPSFPLFTFSFVRCPVCCPPRSRPPFARACASPSFPRRQGVQQGEPAPTISAASPFTHPPFALAASSRPTGVATPFASPYLSRLPFPPPPFSRKRGRKGASVHPLPVVRGHLPARFLATALGTAPPCSPAPPACLALCAHARTQERQCATPPTFCLRAVLSARGAPYPLPVYAPHPAHTPSTPLCVRRGRSTDSAPPSPPFRSRTISSAFTPPPPPPRPPPLCAAGAPPRH